MKTLLLSTAILSIISIGCSKDSDDGKNKNELITSASWKFSDAGIDSDRNGDINTSVASSVNDCLKDNLIVFVSNGTGTVNESANVCPNASQSTPFTWNFTNNESDLTISGNAIAGISGTFKINTLTESILRLSRDTSVMGFNVSFVVEFSH